MELGLQGSRRDFVVAGSATLLASTIGHGAAGGDDRLAAVINKAKAFDQMHALIIGQHGKIIVSKAFRGPKLDATINVKSVSKSIVASVLGAAIDRGLVTIDTKLTEIIPDLVPKRSDPKINSITLAHLVTMTAGLERTSGRNYGRWVNSDNWVQFALSRPFVSEPGARMLYSTGSYHLLGVALARAAGADLRSLARNWLGKPLGFALPPWTQDPQGHYMGGNNMGMRLMDVWRFGEMWRLGGIINGEQILSTEWVRQSWQPRTFSPFSGDDYGYGWFLSQLDGQKLAYARGYGGQMLYIMSDLGLTIAISSDPNRPARSHGYAGDLKQWLRDDLLRAVQFS